MKRHIILMPCMNSTGSTLLAELLASHPDYTTGQVAAASENRAWGDINQALLKVPEDEPIPEYLQTRVRELLVQEPGNLVLKIQSSCFTIHRWIDWFDDSVRLGVVVTYRTPSCIAASLRRRGEFEVEDMIARYYGAVFGNLAKCPTVNPIFVRYEDLMTNTATEMMLVAMELGMPEPYEFDLSLVHDFKWRNRPASHLG